jgi:hypothetical protein
MTRKSFTQLKAPPLSIILIIPIGLVGLLLDFVYALGHVLLFTSAIAAAAVLPDAAALYELTP